MRRMALIGVSALALASPAAADAGIPEPVGGHVGVRTGPAPGAQAPLSGATVELQSTGGATLASTSTSASGDYSFPSVAVGAYEIVASKAGYVSQCRAVTVLGTAVTAPLIELPTADQAGDMNGHVTDSFTDEPIQDATVAVGYEHGCEPAGSDQTDTTGLYVFPTDSLPGPVHTVGVSAPGYHPLNDTATIYSGTVNQDYALDPLDTTEPRTRIRSVKTDHHSITVRFKMRDPEPSDGGLNATCEIDQLGGDECTSPQTYGGIHKGKHRIKITAFDAAGNFDETPAKEGFRIG